MIGNEMLLPSPQDLSWMDIFLEEFCVVSFTIRPYRQSRSDHHHQGVEKLHELKQGVPRLRQILRKGRESSRVQREIFQVKFIT